MRPSIVAALILPLLRAGFVPCAWGQADGETALAQRVLALLESEDSLRALSEIEAAGSPDQVAQAYFDTALALYNEAKAPAAMVRVSQAGMHYCLLRAHDVAADDGESAYRLRSIAKAIAFNLGANTWPAWDDEGIELTESDIAAGHDAAKINLRLAGSLQKGPGPTAAAHWLLGAHEMVRANWDAAREQFAASAEAAEEANDTAARLMAEGYAAMVDVLATEEGEADRAGFDAVLDELSASDSEDAGFYSDQLVRVLEFFER